MGNPATGVCHHCEVWLATPVKHKQKVGGPALTLMVEEVCPSETSLVQFRVHGITSWKMVFFKPNNPATRWYAKYYFDDERKKYIYIYIYICVCVCVCVCYFSSWRLIFRAQPNPFIVTRAPACKHLVIS
jgi:hypothetical protein